MKWDQALGLTQQHGLILKIIFGFLVAFLILLLVALMVLFISLFVFLISFILYSFIFIHIHIHIHFIFMFIFFLLSNKFMLSFTELKNDLWKYTPVLSIWELMEKVTPVTPRAASTVWAHDNNLYLYSGSTSMGYFNFQTFEFEYPNNGIFLKIYIYFLFLSLGSGQSWLFFLNNYLFIN